MQQRRDTDRRSKNAFIGFVIVVVELGANPFLQRSFDEKYVSTAYPIYATGAPGRSAMLMLNFYQ
ncbi:hypothetical protein FVF58_45405 [Paraburkholderia panacisoli]|uniref:Uncharacterized protein n=1 Tax=Paraburkholderia panacisoli TaxID=2603818 RepID=A0A5B0G8F7_9BURK|nr:hypothetical protein [Paraburkholderia panacisoli]KAA0998229.1 hypothetical protein FVF58_45405 [Paraburkholderia panacisoli]